MRILVRSTEDRSFRILSVVGDDRGVVTPVTPDSIGSDSPQRKAHSLSLRIRLKTPNARAAAGTATIITDDVACWDRARIELQFCALMRRYL